jgi:rhodanese-related sulfurtransferase
MSEFGLISTAELQKRLSTSEEPFMIDVREHDEVAEGMIPGAKHIRMSEIPEHLNEIPQDREVVVICRSGGRSGRVCEYLVANGYTKVTNMTGGMLKWTGEMVAPE